MSLPELHLSRPGVSCPETQVDNEEILARVRARFKGSPEEWTGIEAAIRKVFGICKTKHRYLDTRPEARVAQYAVEAVQSCLDLNEVELEEVDLLISGSVARQYFEPATAMEIAGRLGLKNTHAFDVTSACVGHLEALQVACGYMAIHPHYHTAVICTSELTGNFLSYDIQSVADLADKAAGLTIGNGAACMLLRRVPWPGGGLLLRQISSYSAPAHWDLCQAPIDGTFRSSSIELMRLSHLITPRLKQNLADIGWAPNDVDHYVFHQPSEAMVKKVLEGTGADPQKGIYTHHLYGNTASASVGLAFHQLFEQREVRAGDKIVLGSAAAGFTMVVAAGEWTE